MNKKTFEEYFNDHTFIKWVTKKHWFNLGHPPSKKYIFFWSILSVPIIVFILYNSFSFQTSVRYVSNAYEVLWFFVWPGLFLISIFFKFIFQNKSKK